MSWGNGPGARYTEHVHAHDKVLVVVDGSIRFFVSGGAHIDLAMGDRMDLPAGTGHGAVVGAQGVRCLEGHLAAASLGSSPRRMADWASSGSPSTRRPAATPETGDAMET